MLQTTYIAFSTLVQGEGGGGHDGFIKKKQAQGSSAKFPGT